ncbi:MAG: FecR domain-containing protein, partial [Bacteroidota bacterium]|nr:FecR domain-containing protein [Bacteroidota bacterium]
KAEEQQKVKLWLENNPENKITFETLKQIYSSSGKETIINKKTELAFAKVAEELELPISGKNKDNKVFLNSWTFRAAAIFILLLAISWLFTLRDKPVVISNFTENVLWDTLPDGTVVCLNENSELVLDIDFNIKSRITEMKGEVFFNVVQDKTKPFIVSHIDTKVKVTGTSFNIRCSENDSVTEVFVESGNVQFYNSEKIIYKNSFKLDLMQGEIASYKNNEVTKHSISDPNYLAWKTGILIFKRTALSDVVHSLEKHFGIKIDNSLPNPDRFLISAKFEKKPVNDIIERLNKKLEKEHKFDEAVLEIQ